MKNARKLITYIMVVVLLLSNFENRLYADENGETTQEPTEIITEISEPSTNEEPSDPTEEFSETSNEDQTEQSESTDEQSDSTESTEPTSESTTEEGSVDSDTVEPSTNEEPSDPTEESSETSNEDQTSEQTEQPESTDEQSDSTESTEPTSESTTEEGSVDSDTVESSTNEESSDPTEESSETSNEDQTAEQTEQSESTDEQQNTTEEPEQTEPTENTSEEPTNESTDTNKNESTEKEEKSDSSSDTDVDNDVRSSLKAQVMKKNTPMLRGASTFTYGTIEITRPENYAGTGPASFVIMDRNLGATSNDITSSDSYGYHFQWGNNYGFPSDGSEITTGSEQVDASSYGPSKPYSSDTFIIRQTSPYDWSSVKNDNLRGGSGDSASNNRGLDDIETTAVNRQGPCDEGYHVPSAGEWSKVFEYWCLNNSDKCSMSNMKLSNGLYYNDSDPSIGDNFRSELKIPFAGDRSNDYDGSWSNAEDNTRLRSSSPYGDYARYLSLYSSLVYANYYNFGRDFGFSVRCFKNSPSASNSSILSLSAMSGGVILNSGSELIERSGSFSEGTTITIEGDTLTVGDQTFTAIAETGATFSGWNNSCGATLTSDCSIVAEFTQEGNSGLTSSGAISIITEDEKTIAHIYDNDEPIELTGDIEVDEVIFDRVFIPNVIATIVLPFDLTEGNYAGGEFYLFKGIQWDNENEQWIVKKTKVSNLTAHTPYIYIPSEERLTFSGGVTLQQGPAGWYTEGDWTFQGTYTKKVYETNNNQDYGFAGEPDDDIQVGMFVKASTGAWVSPMRAYVTYNGDDPDHIGEANFIFDTLTVFFSANGSGSVNKSFISALSGTEITISNKTVTISGETVTATPNTSTKVWKYSFKDWESDCGDTVTHNCTITGNFQSSKQKYLITFENEDGTVLQTGMVAYEETPSYEGENPTKAPSTGFTYSFSGWTPELTAVTGNATYTATYTPVERLYTINFKNDNGEELQTLSLHHGDTPEYTGLTPTKAPDQQYTYTFSGWTPKLTAVTGDVDYTAQYSGTLNKYSIIFTDEDGTPLLSGEFEYGTTPKYTGLTPQKTGYLFDGRNPALAPVTGDFIYEATFTPGTGTTYTVKTYLQNLTQTGYELSQERTFTGTTDTDTEVIPETITGFSLSGTVEQQKIKGDNSTVVELYYDRETYTIKWYDDEGSLKKTAELPYGAVPPKDPILKPDAGGNTYVFSGWNPEIVEVTGDATYTAVYKEVKKKHTISWFNESGSLLGTTTVEYGDIPTHDPLTKTGTAEWEYVFSGWNPEITEAYTDASYKAVFNAVKKKYEIGFYDEDGTVLQTGMVEYGATPTYNGENPTKAADAQYTYTFAGRSPTIEPVTDHKNYTGTYTSTINQYTVIFKNSDGEVLQSGQIEYGVTPTYNGSTPTSGGNAEYTYSFSGWTPSISSVTEDTEYTAVYTSTRNQYTITWKDDEGDVIDTTKVEYGRMPTHTDPEKVNTAEYTYSFSGWTPALTEVTGDATYQAEFTSTKNQYNIIFKNSDGEVLQSGKIEYGVTPTYNGSTPTSGGNAEYTYSFSGWTPSISSVTEDAEYMAVYTSTRNQYTITWKDDEGKLIDTETLYYGDMPKDREITKSRTAEYTYTFSGWTPEVSEVTGDITYKAEFNKTKNSYLILFINTGGIVLANPILEYGVMPEYTGEIPPLHTAEYTYTFSGWEPELTGVTQEAAYNAVYTQTKNQYEVIFKNWDGTVIQSGVFEYGQTPTSPNTGDFSVKTGYLFAGRDKPVMMVTETGIYQATIIPNTGTLYTVNTYLQNLDLTGYELANQQTLTGTTDTDTEVIPENITGFYLSGTVEQKNIEGDNSTVIDLYYKRNTYEISFNTNGGKAIPAMTGIYETSFTAPIPTYAGYNFKGWFTNTGLTEAYTGSLFKEDLTLYAKWEKKPSSGGSGGGGGGGSSRIKDKCPDGDYSNSYYDGTCGTAPTNTKEEKSEQTHGSAEVIECPADVSAEDCSIYKRARKYGLTSMKTYEDFKADDPVTRDEMAKIIGLYSENYLNQEPIFSEDECNNFKDLGQAKGDLGGYIIRACQLGIMGIKSEDSKPMNIFRPRDNLQKKEAITLADRAFYGNVYEGTQKYWYQSHLAHLVSLGTIKEGNEDEDFLRKEVYGLLMKLHYIREVENEEVVEAKINLDEEEKEEEHGAAEEEKEEPISCPEDADERGCAIYKRARDFGLTSTKTYEDFKADDPVTRDEMAKIIGLYSEKYLKKKTIFSEDECTSFKDLGKAKGDLGGYIIKACQLGIMGIKSEDLTPMNIFRPRDNLQKKEAVTLVDRAFYGNVYEGNQKYWYQGHLAHLVNLGVIEAGKEDEDFLRRDIYGLLMDLYYINAI